MNRNVKQKTVILTVSVIALVLVASTLISLGLSNPLDLASVEIRQYEGLNLSSINDFRENSIKGPQYVDIGIYRLEVSGLVRNPGNFSYSEIIGAHQNYRKVVALSCVEGWDVTILWQGILVKDLINDAGALPNAKVVIFYAYDGYSTSFPIDYIVNNNILMAYKMNNVTLPPERGFPFQLVAESKWGYKWIKWITRIELSNDTDFRGYWESRGYTNDGDLSKYFLGG